MDPEISYTNSNFLQKAAGNNRADMCEFLLLFIYFSR